MREVLTRYEAAIGRLNAAMLPLYEKALGLRRGEIEAQFAQHALRQHRLALYPEIPASAPESSREPLGVAPHADTSFFTILAQAEVPGLMLRMPGGGPDGGTSSWISVPALPRTFLVNSGEILHRLTNGRFQNAVHRVDRQRGRDRLSVVSFLSLHAGAQFDTVFADAQEEPKWGRRVWCKEVYKDLMKHGASGVNEGPKKKPSEEAKL